MKCLIASFTTFVLLISSTAFAGWQVASPASGNAQEPFLQAGANGGQSLNQTPMHEGMMSSSMNFGSYPNQLTNLSSPSAVYAISVSGSLKENIERIMDRYHWRVIWKAPFDYNFDGRVKGSSLPNVIEKLLGPFPLQATLYMSNRVMTVTPRKV